MPRKENTPIKYHKWKPLRVCIAYHWGSAEVGALADRVKMMQHDNKELVVIGGSPVTLQPIEWTLQLPGKHTGVALLTLRDTARLSDEHTKLEDLGEQLGTSKVDIFPYTKDRMDILLTENRQLYERYALTDARIVLKWLCSVAQTNREVLHITAIPPTTGSASAKGLQTYLGEDFEKVFNIKSVIGQYKPSNRRAAYESFPTQCFLGGMNQTYHLGYVKGTILDLDLNGAYGAAMGVLPGIDWDGEEVHKIKDPWCLTNLMSFALVNFNFPIGTQYPCLPVPTDHGLVYPVNHSTIEGVYVTGPEIHEALRMGAYIQVLKSIIYPTTDTPFLAPYLRYLADQRRNYPDKADPRNAAAKLAINSLYGKFGQGLASRYTNAEIFGEQEIEEGKKISRSPVTFPHAAATITGLVRAVLNVLVNEASKLGTVLSATTDGIMLYVPDMTIKGHVYKGNPYLAPPLALIAACEKHPSVRLLKQGIKNIGNDPDKWLEVKYAGNEAYTFKTRMNWIGWNGETVNQALVGFKKEDTDIHQLIDIREQQCRRYYTDHSLYKIADVIEGKAQDIVSYYTIKEVNLAPDWKRKFTVDETSVPCKNMDAWREYRKVVDRLKWEAFPHRVEQVRAGKRVKGGQGKASTDAAVRRGVLERIAHGVQGYRLPKGMSQREACRRIGVALNALSKLRAVRTDITTHLPLNHPEVERIRRALRHGLW